MIIYSGNEKLNIASDTVVTIGKFDGMHRGHQKLISRMKETAAKENLKTILFTFGISPELYLSGSDKKLLMTDSEKISFAKNAGVDYFVSYPFTEEVRCMTGEDFIDKILINQLHARCIVAGTDFKFGYKRSGDAGLLGRLSEKYGYHLIVEEKLKDSSESEISSTRIRLMVANGDMERACECLGRNYSISGAVIHGNHRGNSFGFPTINQKPDTMKLLPPKGVYVSRVNIDGRSYGGITNIGCKPTVGENSIGVETFLFDFDDNIYGVNAETMLLKFVRFERKFDSIEELTTQINKDAAFAREYLSGCS